MLTLNYRMDLLRIITSTFNWGSHLVSMNDIICMAFDRGKNDFDMSSKILECVLSCLTRSVRTNRLPEVS